MIRAIIISFAALLAGWGSSSVFDVKLDLQRVDVEGNIPVIEWESRVEVDLGYYRLEKKTVYSQSYEEIEKIEPRGAGNRYLYRDTKAYKGDDEVIEYRISAVSSTSPSQEIVFEPLTVHYTPTAVRRTWGSIKAMFQ